MNSFNEISIMPPQDLQLEKDVLGAIILSSESLFEVANKLIVDCFYDDAHRKIYEFGILPLFHNNSAIDLRTITNQLEKKGVLKDVGGIIFLSELGNRVGSAANITEHVLILNEYAIKRSVIISSNKALRDAYKPEIDALDLLDATARDIDAIGLKVTSQPFSTMAKIIGNNIAEIEAVAKSDSNIIGISTGFNELDKITNGWQSPDLIIIAARPGMGKSAFALNLIEHAAIRLDKTVALFSLEMSAEQLGIRSISSQTGIPMNQLKTGSLGKQDWDTLNTGINPLVDSKIFIDDQPGVSVFEMKTKLRRLKHDHPELAMVVVDYIQLMNGSDPSNKNQNREQQVGFISRSLKGIAKELKMPIIALSQLSRAVESRGGDKKPQLSDLRESGAIEQDADIVIFIYRPEYYQIYEDHSGNTLVGKALLIIAKHRNGSLGEIKLGFFGERSKFTNLDEWYSHQSELNMETFDNENE